MVFYIDKCIEIVPSNLDIRMRKLTTSILKVTFFFFTFGGKIQVTRYIINTIIIRAV